MISMESMGITIRDGELKKNNRTISSDKIALEIIQKHHDISYAKAKEICQEWLDSSIAPLNVNAYVEDYIRQSNILDGFCIISNAMPGQDVQTLFYRNENSLTQLTTLPLDKKEFVHFLQTYKPKEYRELRNAIAPYLRPKLEITLDDEAIGTVILNATGLTTEEKYTFHLDEPLKPITLNNKFLARTSINYEYKEKPELSPLLAEFLSRVDFPEQLCAILWLMFNGIKTPYLVYLYGDGGNGKSSFIRMISDMVQQVSAIELDGLFKYYHMYGKALLTLTENSDTHLMQNKLIKEVTGGSIVSCQEKGKKSFSATIDGLLLVDSNSKLKIVGEEYEYRRLRYFEIESPKNIEKISAEEYVKELGKTPDDFLSYCQQCYEKVGKHNLVETAPAQLKKTAGLIDSSESFKYRKALKLMNLYIVPGAKVHVDDFYEKYYAKAESKTDKYFKDNFKRYLRLAHDVEEKDLHFLNVSFEEPKSTPNEVF